MNPLPKHVAIIMDGNGRWGIKNRGNRILGHRAGIDNVSQILKYCIKRKIQILTLFSFSVDNWKRNKNEVNDIFLLFSKYYKDNFKNLRDNKIKIRIIGENKFLPKNILIIKKKINNIKVDNFLLKVNIALNYSSKLEIFNAFKKTKLVNLSNFVKNLYTYPDPDPEIIIRTGNKKRLSDFLLWQSSYSEIFFIKKLWPDFKSKDFNLILNKYIKIKRNFGNI